MRTKDLIKRLEQILLDLPAEAMRQGSELDDLIEELKAGSKPKVPAERGYIIATWDKHTLYFTGTGWVKDLQLAYVYPTRELALEFFGGRGYEIYPVVRNKHGKLRRLFT